jgi:pseudouridine kinase
MSAVAATPRIVCFGGAAIDRGYRLAQPPVAGTSNPAAVVAFGHGGVARNVAETLARLGLSTELVTAVGDDSAGREVLAMLMTLGIETDAARIVLAAATAHYLAITDPLGELVIGVAAMDVLDRLDADLVAVAAPRLVAADWVFAECNSTAAALAGLAALRHRSPFRLALDAVSTAKARRLPDDLAGIDVLFLNLDEASATLGRPVPARSGDIDEARALAMMLRTRGAGAVVLTLGAAGAVVAEGADAPVHLPATPAAVVDVTGAGDALVAGTLAQLSHGCALAEAVRYGGALAALTLETSASVRTDLATPALKAELARRLAPMEMPS